MIMSKCVVSGHNATDKTPMYEMPLIFVFGVWGFEVGESIFCVGVLGVGVLSRDLCSLPEGVTYYNGIKSFICQSRYLEAPVHYS